MGDYSGFRRYLKKCKVISGKSQRNFIKFKGCPKKVFRMLQLSFRGISREIKSCFKDVLMGFKVEVE